MLLLDTQSLDSDEAILIHSLQKHPGLKQLQQLAQQFKQMVQQRKATTLDSWLNGCKISDIPGLQTFAMGIQQDYDAVRAALETAWSNGPSEGHINRLKTLKRQMYGRANLDLLRIRLLHPIQHEKCLRITKTDHIQT